MAKKKNVSVTNPAELQSADAVPAVERRRKVASWAALNPAVTSSTIAQAYGKKAFEDVNLSELTSEIDLQLQMIEAGEMSGVEQMMYAQAVALQTMFTNLALRASTQTGLQQIQTLTGLALKAQAQSRATLTALAEVKFPRAPTFIKQANIAQQQQVNNGKPQDVTGEHARAHEKNITPTNELLTEDRNATLDARGTGAAIGINSQLEAVEAVHRPENAGRQSARKP